jgi:antirestriction protein ArdC
MTREYTKVTDRIVGMLEAGTRPWAQGWNAPNGGGRPLRQNGQPYRGMNVLNLWAGAMARGFQSSFWMTYKGAQELQAQVKKGAKSELAFYVGTIMRESDDGEEKTIPFLKSYCVFNADEIDGLPAHFYAKPELTHRLDDTARMPVADAFISMTGARIEHGGGRAFYSPSMDKIQMPEFGAFDDASAYYATAFHELTHWTGAMQRLDRTRHKIFADPDYAFEELIAELGAAYLCADLSVTNEPREDHAAYIASWIKCCRADPRNLFRAAGLAEKAAGYLHEFQAMKIAA